MKKIQKKDIEQSLQTVFDPEFPLLDIRTMGLIYDVKIDHKNAEIRILMTFTSPACPMADMIIQMSKDAVSLISDYYVDIEITFEPPRTKDMIQDEDIKKMFDF